MDTLIHPILRLLAPLVFEVTVLAREGHILVYHIPDFLYTYIIIARIGKDFREPTRLGRREEVQGIAELRSGKLRFLHIVAVCLVDNDTVCHFHNTPLNALELIACARQLDKEEEIDHRMNSRLALPHTDGLHKHRIKPGSLAEDNRLARLPGHPPQRTGRGRRTDKGILLVRKRFHAGLVAQDTALRTLAARVDGQHGELMPLLDEMHTKDINRGTFPRARNARDANAHRTPCERKALLDNLLRDGLMLMARAFDERHRLAQDGNVTLQDAFNKFCHAIFSPADSLRPVRIDGRGFGDAFIDFQSFVFFTILRMFHTCLVLFMSRDLQEANRPIGVITNDIH